MLRIGMLPMTCMGNYQKAVDFAKEANEYALKLKEDGIDPVSYTHLPSGCIWLVLSADYTYPRRMAPPCRV